MSRPPPTAAPPPVAAQPARDTVTQVRHYRLITPLFGGGVHPGVADPLQVVRGAEVRGQLRFWWRATRGGQYATVPDLKAAEAALWGAASLPDKPAVSRVQVAVQCTNKGTELRRVPVRNSQGQWEERHISDPGSGFGYVAFPLKEEQSQTRAMRRDVEFTLTLTCPDNPADRAAVAATLWAWETFGGLGARTRRGCGAIQCLRIEGDPAGAIDLPPTAQQAAQWLGERLDRRMPATQPYIVGNTWPPNVPRLTNANSCKVIVPFATDAEETWRYLFNRLLEYRQTRTRGRRGRNWWPEADVIREITHVSKPAYSTPMILPLIEKFPRAEFGLPIIFQFKDRDDPSATSLQGAKDDQARFASPLILRPLACADGTYAGLGLLLWGSWVQNIPGGLVLKRGRIALKSGLDASLTAGPGGEADRIAHASGRRLFPAGGADPLADFIDFL